MKPYLSALNDVQRIAVTNTEGPVLVVAGPGSGKTRVLTYRIAHLIEEGVAPWEILALTFTNKAAKEMKERIRKVVGDKADQVWAGTFHSIFAKILRVEATKIGYQSNFTIYDSDDSKSLIGAIVKEMNLDKTVYNINTIRARISSAKSNIIPPRLYKENPELMEQDRMAKRPQTHVIYEKYVKRCKRAGAMDFDDLLYQLYVLWYEDPDNVIEKYRKKFKYVLVDEFQDTNYLQYSILKRLVKYQGSPENICAVGDDAQSIYAFRGATIENILDFEKDFKALRTFKLEQNYRSTDHIVQAANEVISYNKKQIQKKIWSDKGTGHKIKVLKAIDHNEEGKRVVDTIVEQKNRQHLKNSEIAVLYRTNSQSRVFEEYLRRYNLTYRVYGGLSFYQRKEIKDLLAYLRLTINPNDEEALRRIINFPKRAIGNTTISKISELAAATDQSMWDCLPIVTVSPKAKNAIQDFVSMMKVFMQKAVTGNAYEVAAYVAKQSKLLDFFKRDTTIEGMNRLENIIALLDGIKDFVENDEEREGETVTDKSLGAYIQNIALLTDFDDESKTSADSITLMSVHSAKGLEFKSVFVVGLEEKLFPSFMSLETADGIDEERRLFYVAITRAELFLTLSFANERYQFGKMRYNAPSRFIEEVSQNHLESSFPMRRATEATVSNGGAKVIGNFKNPRNTINTSLKVDPATFKPNASTEIQTGMKVLHLKFGEGKVLSIDGAETNRVATIFFKGVENPQRRIMLKFAKLQIL